LTLPATAFDNFPAHHHTLCLDQRFIRFHCKQHFFSRLKSMSANLLDGTTVAKAIKQEVADEVAEYARRGLRPGLAAVLVGNDPASHIYVSNKVKSCEQLGLYSDKIELPEATTTEELLGLVNDLNSRDEIDGILVQMPLPAHVDAKLILNAIDPAKDVDGLHPVNVGRLALNETGLRPCTPTGIMEMLTRYEIKISGANAVVLGRSRLVGLPMALMLLHQNATVTICHSRTQDLPLVTSRADILIAAIGRTAMVDARFIKPGAVVVDIGMNQVTTLEDLERFYPDNPKRRAAFEKNGQTLIGDVNPKAAMETAGYFTPVPGGVGPLTIALLMKNTLKAMKMRRGG
jgi:methylenetetrahydrofolate dehydrogenase (NADP+)/methenyltetrahydrofolate cyclohydrolase